MKRRLLFLAIGLALITQFNNCGSGSDNPNYLGEVMSPCDPQNPNLLDDPYAAPPNTDCAVPDELNLAIQPYVTSVTVEPGQGDLTVGGSCNTGGYPSNMITWQLELNGEMVRNSGMISTTYGTNMNTQCIDGQYSSYIELAALSAGDTTDRTGLLTSSGTTASYTLVFTITGYTSTGQPVENQVYGVRTINLNP